MYHILLFISLYAIPYKTLTWEDFKMLPPAAEIARGYVANVNTRWTIADSAIDGRCYFIFDYGITEGKSWVLPESKNDYNLRHEQTHVMISYIWARECIKRLNKYQGCPESESKKAHAIFDYCWKEERRLNALFDKETAHAVNISMERQWEIQIIDSIKKAP